MSTSRRWALPRSEWLALAAGGSVGIMIVTNVPVILGVLARTAGYDVQALGLLASIELIGMCGGVMAASWYVLHVRPARALRLLALVHAISYLAVAIAGIQPIALGACLFIVGFTGGGLTSVALAELGKLEQSDRALAFFNCAGIVLAALYAPLLDLTGMRLGLSGMWILLAATALLVVPLSFLGSGVRTEAASASVAQSRLGDVFRDWTTTCVFVGIFLCGLGIMMPWTFVERMGASNGLTSAFVSSALAAGMIISIPATAIFGLVAHKMMRRAAVLLSSLMLFGCATLFAFSEHKIAFIAAASAFQLGWSVIWIALLAMLAAVDRRGQLIVLGYFTFKLAYAIAPAVAGSIASIWGYQHVVWVAGTLLLIASALIASAERVARPASTLPSSSRAS